MLLLAQSAATDLPGLAGFVASIVAAVGILGVGLLVAGENLFPPIPSEVILPFAGFLAARGEFGLVWAITAATVGSVVGAVALYEAGRRLGQDRLRRIAEKIPLVEGEDIEHAEDWFHRHGSGAVFTGRLVPFIRSVVSIPAGADEMPRVRFLLLTAVGSALWNALLTGAGFLLGEQWRQVGTYADWINYAMIAVTVYVIAHFAWKHRDRLPSYSG